MPSLADKLNKVYTSAPVLPYDKNSRIVIMSDCHRGQGNGADNFLPNSPIFQGALNITTRMALPISNLAMEMNSGKTDASTQLSAPTAIFSGS